MAGKNGGGMKKVRHGVHAHERNMHPGKPLTKINNNGNGKSNGNGGRNKGRSNR